MYLEKEMATHSSILAWRIPWTEEPGGLQSTGSQSRTRLSNFIFTFTFTYSLSVIDFFESPICHFRELTVIMDICTVYMLGIYSFQVY